jgi:hypothetical protein
MGTVAIGRWYTQKCNSWYCFMAKCASARHDQRPGRKLGSFFEEPSVPRLPQLIPTVLRS